MNNEALTLQLDLRILNVQELSQTTSNLTNRLIVTLLEGIYDAFSGHTSKSHPTIIWVELPENIASSLVSFELSISDLDGILCCFMVHLLIKCCFTRVC